MLKMPRAAKALLAVAVVAMLAFLLHPPTPAQVKPPPLIAGGETPDLLLLYTGDVIGYIDPCG